MRFIRGKRWVEILRRQIICSDFFFVPFSYSWGILLLIRNSIYHQELHQLPRVMYFLLHLHHCPMRNHLQPECQTVSYPNDLLILIISKPFQNNHGQVQLFLQLSDWLLSPCSSTNTASQQYPSSHIWNLLLHYGAWNPYGAFAHYTFVKCLGWKPSLNLSAAFYPLECFQLSTCSYDTHC